MKTISKTGLISLAVAAALATAPQAFAHTTKKAHKHTTAKKSAAVSTSSAGSSTDARLHQLEAEVRALRGELGKTRAETKSQVNAVAEKAAAQDAAVQAKLEEHEAKSNDGKSTVFFRGGYAAMDHARTDELLTSNTVIDLAPNPGSDGDGWYVGAGFDHRLTNDLWGLTDLAALDAELMFEYKNFGSSYNTLIPVATGGALQIQNQITQFTLTAAPKVKFNTGTIFTPWVIPFGLGLHVISPPSSGVTVLNPGLMLGVGGEVELWKALVAGIDFRYHFTGGDLSYKAKVNGTTVLNSVDTDGLTTGAYLGFKF